MSATETKVIVRKISICVKHDCMRCPIADVCVPDDCEWAMKHILCTEEEGEVIDLPRRGGKTTRVMALAAGLANMSSDVEVMMFVATAEMANSYQKLLMGTGVELVSVGGWKKKNPEKVKRALYSRRGVVVLSDEVYPWISKVVNKMKHNRFLVGYYSSVG